jgi:hypothetical protein
MPLAGGESTRLCRKARGRLPQLITKEAEPYASSGGSLGFRGSQPTRESQPLEKWRTTMEQQNGREITAQELRNTAQFVEDSILDTVADYSAIRFPLAR